MAGRSALARTEVRVSVDGVRSGGDFRWLAYAATNTELGQYGSALVGATGWLLAPTEAWHRVPPVGVAPDTLDARVLSIALSPGTSEAAEEHGLAYFEGARARHCRVAIDGPTFRAAFPQAVWLLGSASLGHWRGELDYWLFSDGELGRASGFVSGDGGSIVRGGLQGRLTTTMIATYRDSPHPVNAPVP